MKTRESAIILAIFAYSVCAVPARSGEQRPSLTLLVHDYSGLSASVLEAVGDELRVVFIHAGAELRWVVCRGENPSRSAECHADIAPGRFTLRILTRYPKEWPRRGDPLGSADIASSYVSVYADEIRTSAAANNIEFERLLAYTAAHEVGHLLLGSRHSHSGIMQAYWSSPACRKMSQRWLDFTAPERDIIQRALGYSALSTSSVVPIR